MTDLGNFFPIAINDSGVMLGGNQVSSAGTVSPGGALIYSGGTLQNLNTLIPAGTPYQIQDATAINGNGQVVAQAWDTATSTFHTLLLTPL